MNRSIRETISREADSCLGFLGRNFPVMSASDEFMFFPRAGDAAGSGDRMEDLGGELICGGLERSNRLLSLVRGIESRKNLDLRTLTDARLLGMHAANFVRAFSREKAHIHNPELYYRIAVHGLALVAGDENQLNSRLGPAARLLENGDSQVENVRPARLRRARQWAANFSSFIDCLGELPAGGDSRTRNAGLERLRAAGKSLEERLGRMEPAAEPDELGAEGYARLIEEAFGMTIEPGELYHELEEEGGRVLAGLKHMAEQEGGTAEDWRELATDPHERTSAKDPLSLYSRCLESLARWIGESPDLADVATDILPEVRPSPPYMRGLRAMASYSAPSGGRGRGVFYVSPDSDGKPAAGTHRDYRFVTVHETLPGHHHLDRVRLSLAAPVRRRTENAMFYEGWACWAEQRMADAGYFGSTRERMCIERRKYQRCLRSMCELGLHTGLLRRSDCLDLLGEAGFRGQVAGQLIDQYLCQPGYQLTYTLGRMRLENLAERFARRAASPARLAGTIARAGQLPFGLLESHLEEELGGSGENPSTEPEQQIERETD